MVIYKEALEQSLKYFNGDELAAQVFAGKYALTTPDGDILEPTPKEMHERIAKEFFRIEKKYPNSLSYEEILEYLTSWKIVPQGSPMSGIGNPYQLASLSNCFVVDPPGDSYGNIFKADQELAQIMKRRGGVGLDISTIRPKGMATSNAAKTTDGIGVFMERFSNTCREVAQCIAEGERVLTKRGLVAIENIIPSQDFVWTKQGWVSVLEVKQNGLKEVHRVTSNFGYSIKTTLDHVFVNGENQEQKLGDFETQDEICILPGIDNNELPLVSLSVPRIREEFGTRTNYKIKLPTHLNENLAYFVGYSYGDGCVERSKLGHPDELSLACSNDHPDIKTKLINIGKEEFDYEITPRKGDGNLEKLNFHSVVVLQFLEENDLLKQKSLDIRMPKAIWNSPSNVQMAFLSGYFDADGYASGEKKGYVFSSISRSFLNDVQTILLTNGIVSKFHTEDRSDKGWHTLHSLCVVGKSSQDSFVKLTKNYSNKVFLSNHVSKRDCMITPWKSKDFNINSSKYSYLSSENNLSVSAYRKYISESERFELPNALIKDSIREIEIVGLSETYDLVLEKEHLFWCEGYYVHNSGRRGALMETISIHHPEIETFINIKRDLKKVTGANISIKLSDEFMTAVKNDTDVELRWPVDSKTPKVSKRVKAKDIWDQIVDAAWSSAEPGLLFWDTALRETPAHCYPEFVSSAVNPCAELLLSPYDSCRLLLVNAYKFVLDPFTENAKFDYESFAKACQVGQRLMDDLIDLEIECVDKILNKIETDPENDSVKQAERELWTKIKSACVNGRRTGLGITAIGDSLAALNVVYGTKQSIEIVEHIYKNHALNAYRSTVQLAKERNPFPAFVHSLEKDHPFINRIMDLDPRLKKDWEKYGRRNIALTTTAPAGSVSVLTQTTSGIEPAFMLSYKRRKKINQNDKESRVDFVDEMGDRWQEYVVYHHAFKKWMEVTGKTDVKDSPYHNGTSNDIDWSASVDLQAAAQAWCCHAISKTCNLPNSASKELVGEIYLKAWESGCKGFTVYRDGCRSGVLVAETPKPTSPDKDSQRQAPKRPKALPCDVHIMTVGGEKWTFFVGLLDGRPYEIIGGLSKFVSIPKRVKTGKIVKNSGTDAARYDFCFDFEKGPDEETVIKDTTSCFENATHGAFTRTISLALRHQTPVQYIVEQLIKGSEKEDDLFSFSKAASRVLKQYIAEGTKGNSDKKCKECGANGLVYSEGCLRCLNCGNSKC